MKEFDELVKTIHILRSPGGCPWDKAQTKDNMKHYLLEEVYELIEAMREKDKNSAKEELGDIFLILVVISQMYSEDKEFSLIDVIKGANHKMISRHPHVFSDKKLKTKEEVLSHWIKAKAKKKKRKLVLNRLPRMAPSLVLANIFFKECKYIEDKSLETKERSDEFSGFARVFDKLSNSKGKKKILSELLFDLCRIAYLEGVDLELDLRNKVFKKAKKATYPKVKK